MRTKRKDCHCHINIKYLRVYTDKACKEPHGNIIVEFSDNHAKYHGHDTSWGNRQQAPLPRVLIDKFEDIIRLNPSFTISQRML